MRTSRVCCQSLIRSFGNVRKDRHVHSLHWKIMGGKHPSVRYRTSMRFHSQNGRLNKAGYLLSQLTFQSSFLFQKGVPKIRKSVFFAPRRCQRWPPTMAWRHHCGAPVSLGDAARRWWRWWRCCWVHQPPKFFENVVTFQSDKTIYVSNLSQILLRMYFKKMVGNYHLVIRYIP